ncbi:MAG TPA: hypothetical protein DCM40_27050 [Maribacter sp.]|nr:hypothetical protein [Maribacter sp.]
MGERVNIQYSVDIDELDIEIQRLIKSALIEIQHVVSECNTIDQSNPLTLQNYELFDIIRRKLSKADIIFSDVANILNGYLNYKMNSQDVEQPTHKPVESDDFDELKEKIQNFKDMPIDE